MSWIKKRTGPPTVVVDEPSKLADIEATSPVVVLGYFKSQKGEDYEAFKKLGAKLEVGHSQGIC